MRYTNPILYGDYSDPDVVRVGEDFYMISSSFTYVPGLPVLHSRDLVHWELIGYAVRHLPFARYDKPAHKCGIWAPSLRYHNGTFYIYVCMPDEGLFAFTTKDPAGEWECHYVKDVTGWIDPCPLFDDDGRAWLVHGFAASRAGINNVLYVHKMSPDGLIVLDKGKMVYDGADHNDITVEGPKAYKRDGMYWILCPAGSVKPGYQLALRAENIYGPYERRVVLGQGNTPINGPHQGGWVNDGRGKDWFIHFQDMDAYGRVTHLQPVDWSDGWPVMGKKGSP
ncbi:MAG: glycoside hydrolase 43 family protein, partial [Clostridia bacterium]|nr:glycoside hydrolase 43 family protein [Clostridia bacterium]